MATTGNPLLDLALAGGTTPSYGGAIPDLTIAGGYGLLQPAVDLSNVVSQYRLGRANIAQTLADRLFARKMQLASLAQDPYNPITYLEAVAQSGAPIPMLGRGLKTLRPVIASPATTPADQYVSDFLAAPSAEPSDIERVRQAYKQDPAAADAYFHLDEDARRRLSGLARGGSLMMRHPGVVIDAYTRRPVATIAENGRELLRETDRGVRAVPQPGVSRRLGRARQARIVAMALGPSAAAGAAPAGAAGGKHFIAGAIKHPGALHRDLGIPQGEKIPAATLERAAHAKGKLGQRARFALTLRGFAGGGDLASALKALASAGLDSPAKVYSNIYRTQGADAAYSAYRANNPNEQQPGGSFDASQEQRYTFGGLGGGPTTVSAGRGNARDALIGALGAKQLDAYAREHGGRVFAQLGRGAAAGASAGGAQGAGGQGGAASADNSQQALAKELAAGMATVEGVPQAFVETLSRGEVPDLNQLPPEVWPRLAPRMRAILVGLLQSKGYGGQEDVADAIDRQTAASYF